MWRHVGCLAAVASLALPAWGQDRRETKLDPPDLGQYLRWGPLRVRPLIEVRDLGYDDNIFSDTANPESDYTATIAPSLDGLVLLGSRAFFQFNEKLEYVAFVHNNDQSYLNQIGQGRLTVPFRSMGVYADLQLDRVQERPQDAEDNRRNRDTNGLGGGIILLPGHRTEIELGATRSKWEYSDADIAPEVLSAVLDRVETGASLAARYDLNGRVWLTLDVTTESIEFDNASAMRDSREWTTLPGMQFGEQGPLRGQVRVGWTDVAADDPTLPAFKEVVGDAQLSYLLNPRATVSWNARRKAGFSAASDTNFFLIAEHEVRYVHYVTGFLGVEVGTKIGRLSFPSAQEGSGEFGRVDDTYRYDVGLRLRVRENALGRRFEYRINAGRYRRDSNQDENDLSRNALGLGLVLGF